MNLIRFYNSVLNNFPLNLHFYRTLFHVSRLHLITCLHLFICCYVTRHVCSFHINLFLTTSVYNIVLLIQFHLPEILLMSLHKSNSEIGIFSPGKTHHQIKSVSYRIVVNSKFRKVGHGAVSKQTNSFENFYFLGKIYKRSTSPMVKEEGTIQNKLTR